MKKQKSNMDLLQEEIVTAIREDKPESHVKKLGEKYVSLSVFKLIRDDIFFGIFITKMNREIKLDLKAPAAVSLDGNGFKLMINPLVLFSMENMNDDLFMGILKHEVYHISNRHIERQLLNKIKAPHYLVNIAMDAAINQYIDEFKDYDGLVNLKSIEELSGVPLDKIEKHKAFEYYLDLIVNSDDSKYKNLMSELSDIFDGNNDSEGDGSGKSMSSMFEELENYGGNIFGHDEWDDASQLEKSMVKDIVKNMLNETRKETTGRGKIPGHILEMIEKLNEKPVIPWYKYLGREIGSLPYGKKRTLFRRNRRQLDRYDVSGTLTDRLLDIVVAVDTSGSMGKEELEGAFKEIFGILKFTKFRLTIIEADSDIQKVYTVRREKDVDLNISGRGGTQFTPVFRYIKEKKINPDYLIYFTDGFGESSIPNKYRPRYKTMFVLTDKKRHLSITNTKGMRVEELKIKNM